jgi:hypothetical protein
MGGADTSGWRGPRIEFVEAAILSGPKTTMSRSVASEQEPCVLAASASTPDDDAFARIRRCPSLVECLAGTPRGERFAEWAGQSGDLALLDAALAANVINADNAFALFLRALRPSVVACAAGENSVALTWPEERPKTVEWYLRNFDFPGEEGSVAIRSSAPRHPQTLALLARQLPADEAAHARLLELALGMLPRAGERGGYRPEGADSQRYPFLAFYLDTCAPAVTVDSCDAPAFERRLRLAAWLVDQFGSRHGWTGVLAAATRAAGLYSIPPLSQTCLQGLAGFKSRPPEQAR